MNDQLDGYEEVADETEDAIDALRSRSTVALPSTASMGIRRRWHNEPDGGVTIHTAQDVQPILNATKSLRDEMDGKPIGDFGVLAAKIPMSIYTELRRRARDEHELETIVHAWLEDPDNSCFRIWKGKLGKPQ